MIPTIYIFVVIFFTILTVEINLKKQCFDDVILQKCFLVHVLLLFLSINLVLHRNSAKHIISTQVAKSMRYNYTRGACIGKFGIAGIL